MQPDLGIDPLSAHGTAAAALLLLRVTGLVWTAPVFSSRVIPASVKTALTLLLVLLLWPTGAGRAAAGLEITAATVLAELLVGMLIGLGAAVFVGAAEAAGDMLAVQMGLSGASLLDPHAQAQVPILGQFLALFTTTLILVTGADVILVQTLARTLEVLPLGAPIALDQGALAAVGLGSELLWLGLRFAAPVVAAMMIGNAALGVLARAVPQLNVLMVAFPVQIGVGLFVLMGTLPVIAATFTDWDADYLSLADRILGALAAGGPRG